MADIELVIKIPKEVYNSIQDNDYCGISNSDMYNAIKDGTPKLEIAKWQCVLRGDWIYEQCSRCGCIQDVRSNYCPDCGAQMEESENGKII